MLQLVVLVTTLAASAHASPPNMLLGTWNALEANCADQQMTFSATSQTITTRAIGPFPARQDTAPVTYNTEDPKRVWVIGSRGVGANFEILGPDKVSPGNGRCTYRRQPAP